MTSLALLVNDRATTRALNTLEVLQGLAAQRGIDVAELVHRMDTTHDGHNWGLVEHHLHHPISRRTRNAIRALVEANDFDWDVLATNDQLPQRVPSSWHPSRSTGDTSPRDGEGERTGSSPVDRLPLAVTAPDVPPDAPGAPTQPAGHLVPSRRDTALYLSIMATGTIAAVVFITVALIRR